MSKNEQNELKLPKVKKSQLSRREKVKESQSPGKGAKLQEKHTSSGENGERSSENKF